MCVRVLFCMLEPGSHELQSVCLLDRICRTGLDPGHDLSQDRLWQNGRPILQHYATQIYRIPVLHQAQGIDFELYILKAWPDVDGNRCSISGGMCHCHWMLFVLALQHDHPHWFHKCCCSRMRGGNAS